MLLEASLSALLATAPVTTQRVLPLQRRPRQPRSRSPSRGDSLSAGCS